MKRSPVQKSREYNLQNNLQKSFRMLRITILALFFFAALIQPMLALTINSQPIDSQQIVPIVQSNSKKSNTLFDRGKSFYQLGQWQETIQV